MSKCPRIPEKKRAKEKPTARAERTPGVVCNHQKVIEKLIADSNTQGDQNMKPMEHLWSSRLQSQTHTQSRICDKCSAQQHTVRLWSCTSEHQPDQSSGRECAVVSAGASSVLGVTEQPSALLAGVQAFGVTVVPASPGVTVELEIETKLMQRSNDEDTDKDITANR